MFICGDHGLAAEHAGLHIELADLVTEESRLDILIAQARLMYNEQHKDKKHAYISCKDIRSVRQFRDQTVLVIKAHADTQIHIPGAEHSHRMHIRSEQAEIGVHICAEHDDDHGAENSQQGDHNKGGDALGDVLEVLEDLEGSQATENEALKESGQDEGISGANICIE